MESAAESPAVADQSQSQHFTRSQTRLFYKAAGVLPFSFQYGVPVILLGAELAKTGPQGKIYKTMCKWSQSQKCTYLASPQSVQQHIGPQTTLWPTGRDFGGQREAIDQDSETTASR